MTIMSELAIVYDESMLPMSATCTHCGRQMPAPELRLESPPDVVLWFSVKFLEQKNREHPTLRENDGEEIELTAWNPS
jgi:hypothetical protein